MPTPRLPHILGLLLGLATTQAALHAQATVAGVVVDARNSRPVADATLLLRGKEEQRVTDREGRFRFTGVEAGTVVLEIRHLGFAPRDETLELEVDTEAHLEIRLVAGAIELPPITVETFARRLAEAGFFRRRTRGVGTFLTRQEIAAHGVQQLGDLFSRVSGLRRILQADGTSRIDSRGGTITSRCDIQYFIDGVPSDLDAAGVDGIPVHVVEGIEVYRGGSEVPMQFDRGRAMCGAVLIWTRGG